MSVLDRASHTLLLVSVALLALMALLSGFIPFALVLIALCLGFIGGLHWCEYMDEQEDEPAPPAIREQRFGCWDGACPIKTNHYKRAPGCIRLTDAQDGAS